MDLKSFEALTQISDSTSSRRRFGGMLVALSLGSSAALNLFGRDEADAKKKSGKSKGKGKGPSKKVAVCHDGKTIKIGKHTLKAHIAHGDTRGACPPKHSPVTKADAVCPGPTNDAFGIVDISARLAQTFTAGASGPLVSAELQLIEPPGSTGNYILRLSPIDGAGVPTNIVLAEATLADADVPNGPSLVKFTFASPAAVVAGTSYALVVTRPGSDKLAWQGQAGNNCTGTAFMSPSQTDAFIAVGNIDFSFTTYVTA